MRALTLLHRWLGVAFSLLFAMWFGTGIVMHFVPFPSLSEAERIGAMIPLDIARAQRGLRDAVAASAVPDATRVRLFARADGPVYLVQGRSEVRALHASDLAPAAVQSADTALAIAVEHARRRGVPPGQARLAGLASYDQWTVPNRFDRHRPLYRVALNDAAGTELYVSSVTGEVVLDSTRRERWWNYAGSVLHWIYPTALRSNWKAWDTTVWTLSLVALVAAVSGALLGALRMRSAGRRFASPYRGWHAWHHWLGLGCGIFVLTWIFSGWLSMDHGRVFSTGKVPPAKVLLTPGGGISDKLGKNALQGIDARSVEVEWFAFGDRIFRRSRSALDAQQLEAADDSTARRALSAADIIAAAKHLAPHCTTVMPLPATDGYAAQSEVPGSPVYRVVCGEDWFHVDGATGVVLEKLDPSRRTYRWAYSALHTLDIPALHARPGLRSALIVALCGAGLVFSMTGVVIGWRRLR
jgi:hypothetical protein